MMFNSIKETLGNVLALLNVIALILTAGYWLGMAMAPALEFWFNFIMRILRWIF